MPRIFSLLGRRGWAEANECDYIQPLTESRTLSLAVIICTLVTSAHSNLPVRVPDYLGERWSLVTMWCKFKQNWPTFPTQYLLIGYKVLDSYVMTSSNLNTHKNSTDQWHGLEKPWEDFISFPLYSVGFFHLCVYLFAFGGGGGAGNGSFEPK